MQITKSDVLWNYAATFLKIASSALLLPLILRKMPTETVGIWSVFMTITAFASLLDFGFNPSFTRNITYVFSGVKNLKAYGYESIKDNNLLIDYGLLKGVISAMQWFYSRMAFILFVFLSTIGTYYISTLLNDYNGIKQEVYISWVLLCLINTYNLYSLYYDSLLQGKGLIKRSKQIVIIGQITYLMIAAILIISGYGLIAIVSAQLSSVIIIRWLSYYSFFTSDIKQKLRLAISHPPQKIIKAIFPNAIKIGLTSLGGFLVQRSPIIIGSLYLSLKEIATYGISMQIIAIISSLASIYIATYLPKITQLWIEDNIESIKKIYIKGMQIQLMTFIILGSLLISMGNWGLNLIGSKTELMQNHLLQFALILSLEQTNQSITNVILVSRNEVPFYKSYLTSGIILIIGYIIAFNLISLGLIILIIIPLIIDLFYLGWRWQLILLNKLEIKFNDLFC